MPLVAEEDRFVDCPTSRFVRGAVGVERVGSAETVRVTVALVRLTPFPSVTVTVVAKAPLPTEAGEQVSAAVLEVAHPVGSAPQVYV